MAVAFWPTWARRNMSLGGCFKWSNKFDWEFKTVEYFCPLTCRCTKDTSDETSCPKPFGKNCDELNDCLTVNQQHFCPGFNTQVNWIYYPLWCCLTSSLEARSWKSWIARAFSQSLISLMYFTYFFRFQVNFSDEYKHSLIASDSTVFDFAAAFSTYSSELRGANLEAAQLAFQTSIGAIRRTFHCTWSKHRGGRSSGKDLLHLFLEVISSFGQCGPVGDQVRFLQSRWPPRSAHWQPFLKNVQYSLIMGSYLFGTFLFLV